MGGWVGFWWVWVGGFDGFGCGFGWVGLVVGGFGWVVGGRDLPLLEKTCPQPSQAEGLRFLTLPPGWVGGWVGG